MSTDFPSTTDTADTTTQDDPILEAEVVDAEIVETVDAHASSVRASDYIEEGDVADAEIVDNLTPSAGTALAVPNEGGLERYTGLKAINRSPMAVASRNKFETEAPVKGREAGHLKPGSSPLAQVFAAVVADANAHRDMYATPGAAYLATTDTPDINVEFDAKAPTTLRILCIPDADLSARDTNGPTAALIGTVKVYRTQPDPEDPSITPQIRLVLRDLSNSSNFLDVSVLHHLTPHIYELQAKDPVAVVVDTDSAALSNFVKQVRYDLADSWKAPDLFLVGEQLTPVDKPEQLWRKFAAEVSYRLPEELDVQAVFDDDYLGLSFVSAGETVTMHLVDETTIDADATARLIAQLDQLFATLPTMRFRSILLKSFAKALDDNNGRHPLAFLDAAGSTQQSAILPIELIGTEAQQNRVLSRVDLGVKHMQGGRGGNYARLSVVVPWLCFHALINDDQTLIDKVSSFVNSIELAGPNDAKRKVSSIDQHAEARNTTPAVTASFYLTAFWNGGSDAGAAAAAKAFAEQEPLGPINGEESDSIGSGYVEIPRMPLAHVEQNFQPFTIDRPTPEQYQMALDRAVIQASESGTATDASERFADAEKVPLTLGILRRLIDEERGASLLTIGRKSDGMDHARRVLLAQAITENPQLTIKDVAVLNAELIPVLGGRRQPYDQLLRVSIDIGGSAVAIVVPDTLELDTKKIGALRTWLTTLAPNSPAFREGWITEVFLDHHLATNQDLTRIATEAAQGRILVDGSKFLLDHSDPTDPIKFADQLQLNADDGIQTHPYDVNPMLGEALLGLGYATWNQICRDPKVLDDFGSLYINALVGKSISVSKLWSDGLFGRERREAQRSKVVGALGGVSSRDLASCAAEMFRTAYGNALPNMRDELRGLLRQDFGTALDKLKRKN